MTQGNILSRVTFLAYVLPLLFVLSLQANFTYAESTKTSGLSDYRLGSGDLLNIQVFGEDDLSMEIQLSDAGTISYPFLGELHVLNLTIGQLGSMIAKGLSDGYLVNPNVNVTVLRYREFFINGEIEKPGGYAFQPGLTLQKAVAMAGGFTERASRTKFFISHDGETGDPNLVKLNAKVMPGDIIEIEQSFF